MEEAAGVSCKMRGGRVMDMFRAITKAFVLLVGVCLIAHIASTPGTQAIHALLGGACIGVYAVMADQWL